ncbi:MAG: hypothetical protein NTW52_16395 [Planctomycetota bacterium]|nr:hypothetical protein [Planctomycetota bacterium]
MRNPLATLLIDTNILNTIELSSIETATNRSLHHLVVCTPVQVKKNRSSLDCGAYLNDPNGNPFKE